MDIQRLNHLLHHLHHEMAVNELELIRVNAVEAVAGEFLSKKEYTDFELKFLEEYVDKLEEGITINLLSDYTNELLMVLKEKNLQDEFEKVERMMINNFIGEDED